MQWWSWMTFSVDKSFPECRPSFRAALTFLPDLDTSSDISQKCTAVNGWIWMVLGIKIIDLVLDFPIQWKYFAEPSNYSLILNLQVFTLHLSFMLISSSSTYLNKCCRFSDTFLVKIIQTRRQMGNKNVEWLLLCLWGFGTCIHGCLTDSE